MTVPQGRFTFDVHKNNIRADLFDITPRDDIFAGIPEEPEEFARSRYDDFLQTSGAKVEFHITDKAQTGTISAVDDFLLTQIAKTHGENPPKKQYIILYVVS